MIVFLTQSKYFDQLSHRKTKQKQNKKRFVGVTEKNQNPEESLNTYDGKLFSRK